MATVLINYAASSASNNGLPILSEALKFGSRTVGKKIDSNINQNLFGEDKFTSGKKLSNLFIQSSAYGDAINVVYGKSRVAGNIIWAKPLKEVVKNQSTNIGGGKSGAKSSRSTYSYYATFAIAICEGKINNILQIWADSKLINLSDYTLSFRIYKGSQTQMPDSLMQAENGIDKTPAYRGLAYIVIEEMALEEFGNRIPNFNFEVEKRLNFTFENQPSLEEKITAITIIPGSGEFVYDTQIQNKVFGQFVGNTWIQRGYSVPLNQNSYLLNTDSLVALDNLLDVCPNLEYISLVVNWFSSSTDIASANIAPRVEYKNAITSPNLWQVGTYNRQNTLEVTKDANDAVIYGGTPSDQSVLSFISAIKQKGIKVMFYPMLLVDEIGKPWRGRITGQSTNINNFFIKQEGYNNFISHYANLVKDKVDAFLIGSELKGITSIKNASNQFLGVDALSNLATTVKSIMGANTKISYAADWSEYHSTEGYYNLDTLWANVGIDFIGIDAYFPLTDEPQKNFDKQKISDGWESGEGYNWYYSDAQRTVQSPLEAKYAWKNISWWWNNIHINPNGVQTSWVPASKKIWFTEFGFASLDGTTNQPNVFYDRDSVDGGLPYFSNGNVDYLIQRTALEATLDKWVNSNIVEKKFVWTFDARPYPFFPSLNNVWSDGKNFQKGHWINGKIGISGLSAILIDICQKLGIDIQNIDATNIKEIVYGYIPENRFSGLSSIRQLQNAYFFDIVEEGDKIKFLSRKNQTQITQIDDTEIIEGFNLNAKIEDDIINELNFSYLSLNKNYQVENYNIKRSSKYNEKVISLKLDIPIIVDSNQAKAIAQTSLFLKELEKSVFEFALPLKYVPLQINDLIKFTNLPNLLLRITKVSFTDEGFLKITAVKDNIEIYNAGVNQETKTNQIPVQQNICSTNFEILDFPLLPNQNASEQYLMFCIYPLSSNWNGCAILESADGDNFTQIASVNSINTFGYSINSLNAALPNIIDNSNTLEVCLISGELESIASLQFLNYGNLAIVGDEIIQFQNATLLANGNYLLSNFIRGLFGTEDKISSHTAGEKFILIDNLTKIPVSLNYLGVKKYYKCVSFGIEESEVLEVKENTFLANSLKPLSPVSFNAKGSANSVEFSWIRRARYGANLKDYSEIALDEPQEIYEIEIILNSVLKNTYRITGESKFVYQNSSQLLDLGFLINLSTNNNVSIKVYQISLTVGRSKPLTFNL